MNIKLASLLFILYMRIFLNHIATASSAVCSRFTLPSTSSERVSSVVPHTFQCPSFPSNTLLCSTKYSSISRGVSGPSIASRCPAPFRFRRAKLCIDLILTTTCRNTVLLRGKPVALLLTTRDAPMWRWSVHRADSLDGRKSIRFDSWLKRPSQQISLSSFLSPLAGWVNQSHMSLG